MSVHVFVEGGGPGKRTQTECRKAFRLFFDKVLGDKPHPRISACGSREEAYKDFCRSIQNDRDTLAILLVDSEAPVPLGKSPCAYLRDRGWTNPMPEQQVHLMVQCMESWFLADRGGLEAYYGQDFSTRALPGNPNIEEVPKRDVLMGLEQATKDTDKGRYHKTHHGFEILAGIDPMKVHARSPHARAFLDFLSSQLT